MAKYLPQTLDSVLSQDYENFEVIVVDDDSTDDTAAIVAQYAGKVSYVHRPNGGESAARNSGIKAGTGEAFMFVDADDLLPEKAISTMANRLAQLGEDYCLVHGEMESFDDSTGKPFAVSNFKDIAQNRRKIFTEMSNMILASLVRTQALQMVELFPEHVKWSAITEIIMKLAKCGKFYSLDRVVYQYRIRPDSMSKGVSYERSLLLTQQSRDRLTTLLKGESLHTKIEAWAAHYLRAGINFHQFNRHLARRFLLLSLLIYPFNLVPLKLLRASFLNKLN